MRISGTTPCEISNAIYDYGAEHKGWYRTAVITYDGCTGDLISFSPLLFKKNIPVFFVPEWGVIDNKTRGTLLSGTFDNLIVLGGEMHVPEAFLQECREAGMTCERICGNGPYHANELINNLIASKSDFDGIDIERLIVTSVWNPFDAFAAAAYAGKTNSAFLLEDTQDLDSVAHALSYIAAQNGAVRHLTFLGDTLRFGKLDKEILCKAVVGALK